MYLEDKEKFVGEPGLRPLNEVQIVLYRAADLIRHLGHAKYTLENGDGGLCAGGAIIRAVSGDTIFRVSALAGYAMLAVKKELGIYVIPDWNNAAERTAEEVINGLERAARSYQASEGRGSRV